MLGSTCVGSFVHGRLNGRTKILCMCFNVTTNFSLTVSSLFNRNRRLEDISAAAFKECATQRRPIVFNTANSIFISATIANIFRNFGGEILVVVGTILGNYTV